MPGLLDSAGGQKCGPEHPQTNEAVERETKVRIKSNPDLQARLATHEFIQAVGDMWVFKVLAIRAGSEAGRVAH